MSYHRGHPNINSSQTNNRYAYYLQQESLFLDSSDANKATTNFERYVGDRKELLRTSNYNTQNSGQKFQKQSYYPQKQEQRDPNGRQVNITYDLSSKQTKFTPPFVAIPPDSQYIQTHPHTATNNPIQRMNKKEISRKDIQFIGQNWSGSGNSCSCSECSIGSGEVSIGVYDKEEDTTVSTNRKYHSCNYDDDDDDYVYDAYGRNGFHNCKSSSMSGDMANLHVSGIGSAGYGNYNVSSGNSLDHVNIERKDCSKKKRIELTKTEIRRHFCYNQVNAARRLGVSISTLKRRFHEHFGREMKRWPHSRLSETEKKSSILFLLNENELKDCKELTPSDFDTIQKAFKISCTK